MTKQILSWILSYRVGQLRFLVAKTYLESISQLHRTAGLVFGVMFFIALFASGIILMTFGFAMIAPVSTEGRGLIIMTVGVLALIVSFVGFLILNSERMWIKFLRVESVLNEISGSQA